VALVSATLSVGRMPVLAPKVILEITKEDAPRVTAPHRVTILSLGNGIWQMVFSCGLKEQLDVADTFHSNMTRFPEVDLDQLTSFVGRSADREIYLRVSRGRALSSTIRRESASSVHTRVHRRVQIHGRRTGSLALLPDVPRPGTIRQNDVHRTAASFP